MKARGAQSSSKSRVHEMKPMAPTTPKAKAVSAIAPNPTKQSRTKTPSSVDEANPEVTAVAAKRSIPAAKKLSKEELSKEVEQIFAESDAHLGERAKASIVKFLHEESQVELDLACTGLNQLPNRLWTLPPFKERLKKLDLRLNNFIQLPGEMKALHTLEDLCLCNTAVCGLPEWLGTLPSLKKLDLRGVTAELPKSFKNNTQLEELRLASLGSSLSKFSETVLSLKGLKRLFCSRYKIEEKAIEQIVQYFPSLEGLYLPDCGLSSFPNEVLELNKLRVQGVLTRISM